VDPLRRILKITAAFYVKLGRAIHCKSSLPLNESVTLSVNKRIELGDQTVGCDLVAGFIESLDQLHSEEERRLSDGIGLPGFMADVRRRRMIEGIPPDYSRATRGTHKC
jgi:hypothetical protein